MTEKITLQPCCFVGTLNLATNLAINVASDQTGPGVSGDLPSNHNHRHTESAQTGHEETPVVHTKFLTDEDLSPSHVVHKSPAMFCIFSSNMDDDDDDDNDSTTAMSVDESPSDLDELEVILGPSFNQQ